MEESDFEEEDLEEEQAEEVLDPDNPDDAFRILEKDYNKTLAQIENDTATSQYADSFSKLFEAAYNYRSSEKKLIENVDNLKYYIDNLEKKVKLCNELASKDKETIDELKRNVDHVYRMADAAHYREQAAQEIIDQLRQTVETLNTELDFTNKMSAEADDAGKSLKEKDLLQREKDRLANEVGYLTTKLKNCNVYTIELETKTSEANLKINEISGQLEDQAGEISRMKKYRERLETEIEEYRMGLEDKDVKINELNKDISILKAKISNQESEIKAQKASYMKMSKDYIALEGKYSKLIRDNQIAYDNIDQAKKDLQAKVLDLKTCAEEVIRLKADIVNCNLSKDALQKQIYKQQEAYNEMISERGKMRQRLAMFEKEISDCKKETINQKRMVEDVTKEKDIFAKMVVRAQAVSKEQVKLIRIQEKSKQKLEQELDSYFMENNKQKKQINWLQKEKDRLAEGQLDLAKKIEDNIDDIRQKKAHIFDLKKSVAEQLNQIRQQQNLFEALRSERASLQKSLEEASSECDELRKKLKITQYQTEQLKEDISGKEQQLIKDETIMRKLLKEQENLKLELDKNIDTIKSLRHDIKSLQDEQKRLHKTIMEANRKIRDQSKSLDALMNERDILGSQLVRRNDELALNNDKIKILTTTLHRGEAQYDQRLGDIRLLKIEVKRLRQEKMLMNKSMNNMIDYRQEVFRLERDLTTSRLKCRALEEELEHPVNVHRWRKLEGTDPDQLELMKKIRALQKRLVKQSYEAIDREKQLKESEQLYLNLKEVLAHQPGPAVKEQLINTQKTLKHKEDKLKCLVSELNMAELRTTEYKSSLEKVSEELKELKSKYLAVKKANRNKRMASRSSQELNRSKSQTSEVKFTGGGFRMSLQQISSK